MGESQRNSVPSGGRAVSGDRVRIVTVAFNPGAELAAMFASLRAAAYGLELHVVCVDNSPQPQPATARLCRDNGVTYISRPDNPGFGAATNLGMQAELAMPEPDLGTNPAAILDREQKAPTEEWVMAVNPDIEFPPGAIAALVAGARRNPGGAIYGPALVGSDGQRYPTGRAFCFLCPESSIFRESIGFKFFRSDQAETARRFISCLFQSYFTSLSLRRYDSMGKTTDFEWVHA